MDRAAVEEVDIHDGLDSTLKILSYRLKHGDITLVRTYDRSLPAADGARLGAEPGVDEPAGERARRHRRQGHDHDQHPPGAQWRRGGRDLRRRSGYTRRTCSRASSSRSSPPRAWVRAPALASTSRAGSCSATAATITVKSTPGRTTFIVAILPVKPLPWPASTPSRRRPRRRLASDRACACRPATPPTSAPRPRRRRRSAPRSRRARGRRCVRHAGIAIVSTPSAVWTARRVSPSRLRDPARPSGTEALRASPVTRSWWACSRATPHAGWAMMPPGKLSTPTA